MIAPIETRYGGRRYRSRTEARWALLFDACGIPFQYEAEGYRLPSGPYLPDFWLPGFQVFWEVKGLEPNPAERLKCIELAEASARPVLLAMGQPDERFQILWFDDQSREREGEDEPLYAFARDVDADCGFWLVADDTERWLGGGVVGPQRRGPMFTGALEQAVVAAASERFDGVHRITRVAAIPHIVERELDLRTRGAA